MELKTLALIGAGARGQDSYAPYVLFNGHELQFVAVAEPIADRRERFVNTFHIDPENVFHTDQELFARPRLADAVLICTQDAQHYEMALRAIELGYHVMLEKPISPKAEECVKLLAFARAHGTDVLVCHVLRYTEFYRRVKSVLQSGILGELVSVNHQENVGYWHFAHSFVRGNWRNEAASSPMILAKCCHDMDILAWLLDARLKTVSSFGGLTYFKKENAPAGAPMRCTDGCPHAADCPFYAPKLYLTEKTSWPTSVISDDPSLQARMRALREGPYGRCVFHCDNDVVDHQVASMLFENGVTLTFTVCAYSNACNRTMKFMGTKGELRASMEDNVLEVTLFGQGQMTGQRLEYHLHKAETGHSGGDEGIMRMFAQTLRDPSDHPHELEQSVHSHLMAFACEASRH
ncbi:MAG: Gfo/Idh/MocA family oxidoreductase, partial [Clostridia bacterium]